MSKIQERETLHDYSIETIRIIAELFGWKVKVSPRQMRGPDVVMEQTVIDEQGREKITAVMFIESEVGHDQGGAPEYFENLGKRLSKYIEKYKDQGVGLISIAIVSNAPRRLSNYIRENRGEVARLLGLENILEGYNFFVIPSMMLKEVLPAVLVRAMGAIGLLAPKA